MAQVLDRVKTFFIMMTKNSDVEYIDENIEKAVEAIEAQESGMRGKLEKAVKEVNIPLEDEKIVKKVKVDERIAHEAAQKQARKKESKEKQIGD